MFKSLTSVPDGTFQGIPTGFVMRSAPHRSTEPQTARRRTGMKTFGVILSLVPLASVPVAAYWTDICLTARAAILLNFGTDEQVSRLVDDYGRRQAQDAGIHFITSEEVHEAMRAND